MNEEPVYTTVDDLPKLKKLYNRAVLKGKQSFIFKGQEVLVAYAKYLIQALILRRNGK